MASEQEVIINQRLAGTREFIANAEASAAAVREVGVATEETGAAMTRTSRRGYIMNQALFTVRRMMYGVTLATIATGAAAVKLGWNYNSAMQQARVALQPVQDATFNVRDELTKLFNFTKYTPFQFKDVTVAFRQMYGGMRSLGLSAADVNYYIKALTDALSYTGRTSPGALNRVAVALQHVGFLGRLTGQAVNQLARDGLPVQAALTTQLGLTADQMHNIGKLGIPAKVALDAIAKYIETTPGYANAAYRQATGSLHGLFTTFKDSLSQVMGEVEIGFFRRMQNDLIGFNHFLGKMSDQIQGGGHLIDVITGLNNRFTPGSNGILQFYHLLVGTLHDLWFTISQVTGALVHSKEVWSLVFAGLTAIRIAAWFLAGSSQEIIWGLKILIPLWIAYKSVTMAAAISTGAMVFADKLATVAIKDMTFAQFLAKLAMGDFMVMQRLATATTFILSWATDTLSLSFLLVAIRMRLAMAASKAWAILSLILTGSTEGLTAAFIAFNAALWANPIFLVIGLVIALTAGLVILYFKWKWFHDEVNKLWHDLIYAAPGIAAALTLAFGPLGAAITALLLIIRYWDQVKHALHYTANLVATGGGAMRRATPAEEAANPPHHSFWWSLLHSMPGSANSGIPGAASGGDVTRSGWSWVGEDGPELLHLGRGAQIRPLQGQGAAFHRPESWMVKQPIVIPVYLSRGGKKLGQAVAEIELGAQGTS